MKRRNPAFIILIFLFWYYSTIRERKKPLLQDIFHKVRVTNLTQGGLKAMEELAKLEDERGNPGYMHADGIITSGGAEMAGGKKGGALSRWCRTSKIWALRLFRLGRDLKI